MDIKPLIGTYKDWFAQLKPRQQRLFITFIIVLCIYVYVGSFLKPTLKRIADLKKEERETKTRTQVLITQFLNLDKAKQELETLRAKVENMKIKTADIESKLLAESQIPQLMAEIVKRSQGLTIDFQSVNQKVESDKDGFSRLYIDLKFDSNYENAVNYIKKLEEISLFAKVEEIDLVQSKLDPRNLINAALRLSAIMGAGTQADLDLSPYPDTAAKISISRSPLAPKFIPGQAKKEILTLTGITYRGKGKDSSVIINDTVVKVGDTIEGQKIERILFDSVVVNDGIERRTLKVER